MSEREGEGSGGGAGEIGPISRRERWEEVGGGGGGGAGGLQLDDHDIKILLTENKIIYIFKKKKDTYKYRTSIYAD